MQRLGERSQNKGNKKQAREKTKWIMARCLGLGDVGAFQRAISSLPEPSKAKRKTSRITTCPGFLTETAETTKHKTQKWSKPKEVVKNKTQAVFLSSVLSPPPQGSPGAVIGPPPVLAILRKVSCLVVSCALRLKSMPLSKTTSFLLTLIDAKLCH